MTTVRAKMVCSRKGEQNEFYKHTVELTPVYHNNDPAHENTKFWEATPAGKLELVTSNEMPFEIGKEYYVDVTPAE